jgi:hypothetical protein
LKLLDALPKVTNRFALHALPGSFRELAAWMGPMEAAAVAHRALDDLRKATDRDILRTLAYLVRALAKRMDAEEVATTARGLVTVLAKPIDADTLAALASTVAALAAQMDAKEAHKVAGAAAARLVDAITKATNPFDLFSLSASLTTLAAWMGPEEAAAVAPKILSIIGRTADAESLSSLASAVTALADQMPAEEARKVAGTAAARLLDAVAKAPRPLSHADEWLDPLLAHSNWLTTEDLTELLKQPTCVGSARVAVLRELRHRLGPPSPEAVGLIVGVSAAPDPSALAVVPLAIHSEALSGGFLDRWEAVDRLHAQRPELDLASPPLRVWR